MGTPLVTASVIQSVAVAAGLLETSVDAHALLGALAYVADDTAGFEAEVAAAHGIDLIPQLPAVDDGLVAVAVGVPFDLLAELRARSQDLAGGSRMPKAEEDEIASLRGDIQRLQRYLRDIVLKLAKDLGPGKTIVTILCDYGTRYASKLFNPAFLREKNLPVPAWL